jgi:hypothetical protein
MGHSTRRSRVPPKQPWTARRMHRSRRRWTARSRHRCRSWRCSNRRRRRGRHRPPKPRGRARPHASERYGGTPARWRMRSSVAVVVGNRTVAAAQPQDPPSYTHVAARHPPIPATIASPSRSRRNATHRHFHRATGPNGSYRATNTVAVEHPGPCPQDTHTSHAMGPAERSRPGITWADPQLGEAHRRGFGIAGQREGRPMGRAGPIVLSLTGG